MARKDPYMNDPNIQGASNVLQMAWVLLGAGIGGGASGWFGFSPAIGIVAGVVIGLLVGSLIIRSYGGRATR
jgi:hypothetical protein